MTELRIISRQPSIQNIQIKSDSPKKALTQHDINKLFIGQPLPKFQLIDIRTHNILSKKDKSQFFISILQRWNRKVEQCSNFPTNTRTQFLMAEFLYSSLKRLSAMNQVQIDKQLNILYRWFHSQTKNNAAFGKLSMPKQKNQNQYYMVTQTFKTNPTIIVQQYGRHKLFLKPDKKQQPIKSVQQLNKNLLDKKSLNNNFLTQIQENKDKLYLRDKKSMKNQQNSERTKCLLLKRQENKIMNQELRRFIQKKEIELNQWFFKIKKGRLMSESSKNYFTGKFNTSIRNGVKSSQGTREQNAQRAAIQHSKKVRLHTSSQKRTFSLNPVQNKNFILPEVCEVNNFGLLINPLQVKIKKKRSKKK